MKRIMALVLTTMLLLALSACGGKKDGGGSGISGSGTSSSSSGSGQSTASDSGSLKDGQWPKSVFSKYDIDEFTAGKIVYTEFYDGRYEVNFDSCTADDLRAWTDKLFAKGFRAHEYDVERIQKAGSNYNYVEIYLPEPGSPCFLEVMWDFSEGKMGFEWYGEESDVFDVHWETDEYGDTWGYIEYNLSIQLKPLNTERKTEGTFLGVKAEELLFDNVRVVSLTESGYLPGGAISFYGDYLPTEEDHEVFRCLLIDRLEAAGATFRDAWDESVTYTAQELKDSGKSSYGIITGEEQGLLMDMSEWGHYGDSISFTYRAAVE